MRISDWSSDVCSSDLPWRSPSTSRCKEHNMALQYLAGQRLTADTLQRAVPERVEQAADQSVTSSVSPVDSVIAITVDGLLKIDLEVRYTAGGGGIRWHWEDDAEIGRAQGTNRATNAHP